MSSITSLSTETTELLVVGAGPIGIACGVEARRVSLEHLIFDRGALTNSLCRFPRNLVWFSTSELLEVGGIPLICSGAKPTGPEVIRYYHRVAEHHQLAVRLYEEVESIEPQGPGDFTVRTAKRVVRCRAVVLATGFFDHPNLLNCPGEDLSKVEHYYDGPYLYYGQRVAVIGGGNSAVEAALELYRNGAAEVTLIHRGKELSHRIKYWQKPDIENRIKEGSIRSFFDAELERIDEKEITLRDCDGKAVRLANDFVLALTGYHADFEFIKRMGVRIDSESLKPDYNPETMETNVPGLYCAGVIVGGKDSGSIFIENSRVHARKIVKHVVRGK